MAEIQHRSAPLGEIHKAHNWEYADAAARLAATGFTAADVRKLALQIGPTPTLWMLTNHSPITWVQQTGAGSGGGSGTVTSVAMTVPADLAVSGSPITGAGTLAVTRNNQSANTVLAGPSSGGAATPAYRALVTADMPGLTEAVQDIVGAMIVAGTNMGTITYDDTAGTLTINGLALSTEAVQDIVGAMVQAGANVSVTYDDTLGTLTVAATGGGGGGVAVEEEDGVPAVAVVSEIKFPNGTVTDNTGGSVSVSFYSEAEVDTLLDGKSNTGHTHTASNITDFVEALGDATAALLTEGAGIDLTYDDGAGTLTIALLSTLDANARVAVRKNSAGSVFTRRRLNFIEGTNVTITVADDAGSEEVDVTIAASGGGSGHSIEDEGTPLTARSKLNFVGAGVTVTDDSGDDASVVTIPGGMTNPMTTSQDIIIGGASGAPQRLAKGANGTYLGVDGSGNLAYSTPAGGGGSASFVSTAKWGTD